MKRKRLLILLLLALLVPWAANAQITRLSENFDGMSSLATTYSATSWYAYNAGSSNNWVLSTAYPNGGTGKCVRYNYTTDYTANCYLVSAPFSVSDNMTELGVSLYERTGGLNETFEVFFVKASAITDDASVVSATHYDAIASATYSNTSYIERTGSVTSSDLAGQSVRVVVHCTSAKDMYWLNIDDITVTETSTDPSISLSPSSITVITGFTQTLTATPNNVTGTPTITYTSSNDNVARVTGNGTTATVTAVAPGTATITATMNYQGTDYTATCDVVVEDPSYCTPSFSYSSDYINSFTTTGGEQNINNTNSGQGTGGYSDFYDTHFVSAEPDTEIDFSVVRGYNDTYNYAIWVDWNKDYVFDNSTNSTEKVAFASSTQDWTGSFTIPAGTPAGDYHMRVLQVYSRTPEPCVSASYGEGEDYKLTVIAGNPYQKPENLAVTNLTSSTATITWEAPNSDVQSYKYQYREAGGTWNDLTSTTALSAPLSGLTGNTSYEFQVQAIYAGNHESNFASKTFATPCGAKRIPYIFGFETAEIDDLNCWTIIDEYDRTRIDDGTNLTEAFAHTGDYYFAFLFQDYPDTDPQYMTLISPELTGITNGLHVEFYYLTDGSTSYPETFRVGYSTTDKNLSSFTWVNTITDAVAADYQLFKANYPANAKYVAVQHLSDDMDYLVLDDFSFTEAPSCVEPSGLQISSITTTGAALSWTAGGAEEAWDIYVTDDVADVPDDETTPTYAGVTSNTNCPISSLTSGTTYYVYLRSACDATTHSDWTMPVSFNTECAAIPLPYQYDFEDDALPVCWNTIGTNSGWIISFISNTEPQHGSKHFVIQTSNNATGIQYVVLPEVDENYPLNEYEITFYSKLAGYSTSGRTLAVGVMTDPNDATSFVQIGEAFTPTTTYAQYKVRLNTYTGNGQYIAIKHNITSASYNNSYTYIDNLKVNPLPSCFEPEGLVVSNITHNGATFTWDEVEGANYQYFTSTELVENPTDEQFTGEVNGDHTVTLSTFSGNETYYFYLRRNCGGEDGFSTPVYAMFHTLCNPTDITETEAFAENFNDYTGTAYNAAGVMPDCWDAYTTNTYKPHVVPSSDTYNYFTTNALVMPGGYNSSYAALPEFSNALNTLQISFKWANNSSYYDYWDYYYYYGTLDLGYIKENDVNYNTFTTIQYFYADDDNWHSAETVEPIMLNNLPTDAVRLVFRWYDSYGSASYCCVIDDVEVSLIPTCWQPQNLAASSVSNEGAVLTWERHTMGNETAWVLQYGTDNTFAEGTFTEVEVEVESATDAPTYTIENGLTAETTYYARVKPACDTEGKLWSEVATFETEPDCAVPTSLAVVPNSETPHGATITWNGRNESFIVEYGVLEEVNVLNANFDDGQIPSYFTNDATYPWTVAAGGANNSDHCVIPGNQGENSSNSSLTIEVNLTNPATISFWAKISSESSDHGRFYIDGTQKLDISGTTSYTSWKKYEYNLAAGSHTLIWRYAKDISIHSGDDCFYVDDIVITSSTVSNWVNAGNAENVENTGTFTFDDNEVFDPETTYMARVKGVCGTITTEACAPISFTTTEVCPAPTGLQLVSNTTNSITVTWSQTGGISSWLMRYKKSNETTWSDAITVSGTANTPGNVAVGTTLDAATNYNVQVAAACDPEFEHPLEGIFNTLCGGPIEITEEAPYTQDFEAPVVTASYDSQTGIEVPVCWDNYSDNTYNYVYAKPHLLKAGAEYNYASSGQVLYFYGSGNGYAALPEFTNPLNTLQISFKYATESSSNGTLTLGYITAEDEDYNTFHALKSFSASSNSYQKFVNVEPLLLDTLPDTAARLVFRWYYGSQWGCNIDDVEVSIAPVTQTIALSAGANWFSTYLDITLGDLQAALVAAASTPSKTITIKSPNANSVYSRGRWNTPTSFVWDVSRMYYIIVTEDCNITLEGEPVNPAEHSITIVGDGVATWIGFPFSAEMPVVDAFAALPPTNNDKVKSSSTTATYSRGRWNGGFNLVPGCGYIYISAPNSSDREFTFPTPSKNAQRRVN